MSQCTHPSHSTHSSETSEHPSEPSTAPMPTWLVAAATARRGTPCPRAGHSLVSFSNYLYLFGGYCDYASYVASAPADMDQVLRDARPGVGKHFNSLHQFSYDTGEWHVLHPGSTDTSIHAASLPRPRRHASIVVHGSSLFVYGGFDVNDVVLADLWQFKLETATWVLIPHKPSSPLHTDDPYSFPRRVAIPVARAEHTAIVQGNCMIVFGGYDGKKKLNDTYVYDFAQKQWSRPSNAEHNSPSRRCKHSAVLFRNKMYVLGGFQYKDGDNYALTDMHALDLDTYVWSSVLMGAGSPEALQGHKAVVCGDSMYILGGKVRYRSRVPSPTAQSTSHPMSFGPASSRTAAVAPNRSSAPMSLPLVDGSFVPPADSRSSGLNDTVFQYTFDANKWSILETSGPPPTPRQLHAAVILPTGGDLSSIFLFGGTDKAKQRFFDDLCELRGLRSTIQLSTAPCSTCSSTRSLLDNKMFSDVRFVVEGRPIHAHRCILYARAEYFRNMFDSRMRETSQSEIAIPDVSYDVFMAVLEYLYSGKVKVTRGRLAVDLLKAADMFRIEGLRKLCVEKVEMAVTVSNAAFICQVADRHNSQHLKLYCITFMMQNFREVIKSESFQTLMREDPGGLGHEILDAYSDISPYSSGPKRARK